LNKYETMFLMDPNFASNFNDARQEIERILGRASAEIVFLEKWDERKLAYEIKGRKRGCYVLCYYRCDPANVAGIERDARLSEHVLRILLKRADDISEEKMKSFRPHSKASADDRETESGSDRSGDKKREPVGAAAGASSGRPESKSESKSESTADQSAVESKPEATPTAVAVESSEESNKSADSSSG